MFSHKHYVPVLKSKEGEFKALLEIKPATKASLTPLIDIVDIPWDYVDGKEGKSIEAHLNSISEKVIECWGENDRIFIDSLIEGNRNITNGTHHITHFFDLLRAEGIQALPVSGLTRDVNYKAAVLNILNTDNRGIVLRLIDSDFAVANFTAEINTELGYYGLNPNEVDLIIDVENLGDQNQMTALTIQTFINGVIPYINDWRTLTITSTSFPIDLSGFATGIDFIDRNEWLLWLNLIGRQLNRIPSFGDYGISHTEVNEMDPRLITMSASIRYTCDTQWMIIKGASTKKHGFVQYRNLCSSLIVRPEYSGSGFSWGDRYIEDCAHNTVGTGNATTWRKVGNNHHFEKVIDQISNLP